MDTLYNLLAWIAAYPQLSGILFVLLTAGVLAVGLPGGNLLLLASGMLFGWLPGALLALTGLALAALVTHLAIRTAFGRWLENRAGKGGWLARQNVMQDNALLLVLPRLVPVIPFFALNALYALAGVPLRTFMWTTILGLIPPALLMARIGSQFNNLEEVSRVSLLPLLLSEQILLPLALLAVVTFCAWWLVRRQQSA